MARNGDLTKKELENIKAFRYKTCGLTPVEIYIYEPYWNFLANYCLPDWLAPNALTLIGLCFPLILLITVCVLDPTFTQTLPHWVFFLAWFAQFWYQTIDAIDGKQARRTDNCSPLGQILDHNLDQITFTCIMVGVCATLRVNSDIGRVLLLTPGIMSAHYSIEFRTHFTKMHQTVIGLIGATEQLIFVQLGTVLCGFAANSNEFYTWQFTIPGIEYETDLKDAVTAFAFLTGLHYNAENIYASFKETQETGYAIGCILPYAQFFGMLYASSYSQLFPEYPAYFLILCGFCLTWITAIFNLNSTAGAKFNWLFFEPFIYFGLVYCDHSQMIDKATCLHLYVSFFAVIMVRYVMLMRNIVNQITTHMGLSFLKVKPTGKTRQD